MNSVKFYMVCHARHDGSTTLNREGPTITLVTKEWAYCGRGATDGHDWRPLDVPLSLEELHAKGMTHRVPA